MDMNIAYRYYGQNALYLNMTNRCTNKCKFCIRYTDSGVDGVDLWLEHEPGLNEIKEALKKAEYEKCEEIVMCGYGEPTMRWEIIPEVCRFIRGGNPNAKIRINTNGHGNRIAGRDITPMFEGLVDEISISLNEKNAKKYHEICVCDYGEDGFEELLSFAKKAKQHVKSVVLSVVDVLPPEDIEECRRLAEKTGVPLRVREMIN